VAICLLLHSQFHFCPEESSPRSGAKKEEISTGIVWWIECTGASEVGQENSGKGAAIRVFAI